MGQSPANSRAAGGVTLLGYTEFTASVTISATTAGTANTIVTAPAVSVLAGVLLRVEVYAPRASTAVNGASLSTQIWQDSTDLGAVAGIFNSGSIASPVYAVRYLTPGAGTFTFSWRGFRATGDFSVEAGAGGTGGTKFPGFIRVTSGA